MSLLKKLAVSTIDGKHFPPNTFQLNMSYGQLGKDKAWHLLSKSSQSAGNAEFIASAMRYARLSFVCVDGAGFKPVKGLEVGGGGMKGKGRNLTYSPRTNH